MLTWRRALAITILTVLLLGAGTASVVLHNGVAASPLLYRVPLGPNPASIALDERTGVAFVADNNGVSVVDVHHGSLLRHIADTAPDHNAIAVDLRAGHAFVVGPDAATLSMLDARDGRLLRTVVVHRDGYGVPDESLQSVVDVTHGRVVVVGYGSDTLVSVLDSHSGAVLHTTAIPGSPGGTAVDTLGQRAFVLAFDSLGSSTINAIDTRSGALLRTMALGTPNSTAPALGITADGRSRRIAVDDMRGNVRVFDDRTLHLVFNVNVGPLPGILAIDPRHGYLLAPSPISDSISVLDPRRGALLRRMNLAAGPPSGAASSVGANPVAAVMAYATVARGSPQALTVDDLTDHVLLTRTHYFYNPSDFRPLLDGGSVMMLDVTTGATIRSVPAGVNPVAVAVDHASGRLLVVDAGGVTLTHDPDPWGWTPDWLRRLLPGLPKPASHVRAVSPALDVIDLGQR